jgi:phosphoglycerate dehydrogenase-like enzyme
MAGEQLTIWCNVRLPEKALAALKAGTSAHKLLLSDIKVGNLQSGAIDPLLAEADVAYGQPQPEQIINSRRLKWVHLSSAGYTRYDRRDLMDAFKARGAILTNSSSVFADACAQHALAMILAVARGLPIAMANQVTTRAWPTHRVSEQLRLLNGQTVLMLGFGAIGRRLAKLLSSFEMRLLAVRRTVRGDEPIPTHPMSELDALLGQADHVVNILPDSDQTKRLFDARRFAACKKGAIFYNIGRGATVDQAALRDALTTGHLAAAYLDVTEPEPLPPDHPLWTTPNCFITPHTAGGDAEEFDRGVAHFLENLRRFVSGQHLSDRIV